VPRDYAEALKWYRLAADQGDPHAQYNVGFLYFKGEGVPRDCVRAYMWWTLSAAQGDKNAVNSRSIVAREMTPAQIAEAQKLASEWKPTKQTPQ
jgi:TPR repeat protein